MQTVTCPAPEKLKAYLAGKLDEDTSDVLAMHLLDCADCEQTATNLEREPDTLIELLQADVPAPVDSESAQFGPPTGSWLSELSIPNALRQYELLSRLGTGGMGAVYLGRHKSLDKQVAIKLLPALPAQNAEFVARFQREMRAAGMLDHPAIVRTTDAGQEQGIHFLVMDAIDGMDLSRIARAEQKLSIADACGIIQQAAIGLSHAHEMGIVHRDIKPSNLMLDTNGKVRILDFGLAQVGLWESGSAEITTVGQLMGTLDYMAPEQAERGGAVDYRADLYSLGATLFRLLTGRAPLAAAPNLTPLEKLRLLATHKPPKLRSLRPDVPEELSQIVDAMLTRDPIERPASATHVAELLEPFSAAADLTSLLSRARSKPSTEESTLHPFLQSGFNVDPGLQSPSPLPASDHSKSRGSWSIWLTIATGFALILGGVLFVLETSKGQLVIDSQADVSVKILAVDDAGNRTDVDELHIEPGTKVTRLWNGKYEITLDAASDSFSVTNDEFTISHGQTVVATITSKPRRSSSDGAPGDNSGSSPPGNDPNNVDPRLNSVVFQGESLDTWLRRLKFERSPQEIAQALTAIDSLASEDLREIIEPALTEFMIACNDPDFFTLALPPLSASTASEFDEALAHILPRLRNDDLRTELLTRAAEQLGKNGASSLAAYQPFLEITQKLLTSDPTELSFTTARLLRYLASDFPAQSFAPEVQQEIVRILSADRNFNNEDFWLAYPSTFQSGFAQTAVRGSGFINAELAKRAVGVLQDHASSDKLATQAMIVLRTLVENDVQLTDDQRTGIEEAIKRVVTTFAMNPSSAQELEFWLPRLFLDIAPITPLGEFGAGHSKDTKANMLIVTLNLIEVCDMADHVRSELQELHDAFGELPLYGSAWNRLFEDVGKKTPSLPSFSMHMASDPERGSQLYERLIYVQSGLLLGKSLAQVLARFDEKRNADIDVAVDKALDELASNRISHSPFRELADVSKLDNYPRSVQVLENVFSQQPPYLDYFSDLWLRAAGNSFLASFTRSLRNAGTRERLQLLDYDFVVLPQFKRQDPAHLDELLAWCDEVMRAEPAEISQPLVAATTRMLTGLLVENDSISLESQRRIVDRLETYTQLDDQSFWLATPMLRTFTTKNPARLRADVSERNVDSKLYSAPMRDARIEHALNVLTSEVAVEEQLVCQALLVLRSAIENHSELPKEAVSTLEAYSKRSLVSAASDADAKSHRVAVPDTLEALVVPEFAGDTIAFEPPRSSSSQRSRTSYTANPVILTLNLVLAMDLQDSLKPELKQVHEAVEKLNLMNVDRYAELQTWQQQLDRSSAHAHEVVLHTWYLQAAAMLGKDVVDLKDRPSKLARAEYIRKRRFVQPGDTLAIYIADVLPQAGEPPVIQAGTKVPVTGFPVVVSSEGAIQLPGIEPLVVKDLELNGVRDEIAKSYNSKNVTVNFLMRAGQALELRNVAGSSAVTIPGK